MCRTDPPPFYELCFVNFGVLSEITIHQLGGDGNKTLPKFSSPLSIAPNNWIWSLTTLELIRIKRLLLQEVPWEYHVGLMLVLQSRKVAVAHPTIPPELQKAYCNTFSTACQGLDEHNIHEFPCLSTGNRRTTPIVSRAANLHLRTIAAAIQTAPPFQHFETN